MTLLTVPLQLQLIHVVSSDFNPFSEVSLAVDNLGLTEQLPLLANQNLNIYSHVNLASAPDLLFECTTLGGLDRKLVTQENGRVNSLKVLFITLEGPLSSLLSYRGSCKN
mgnify:CR=1 FL=1